MQISLQIFFFQIFEVRIELREGNFFEEINCQQSVKSFMLPFNASMF